MNPVRLICLKNNVLPVFTHFKTDYTHGRHTRYTHLAGTEKIFRKLYFFGQWFHFCNHKFDFLRNKNGSFSQVYRMIADRNSI